MTRYYLLSLQGPCGSSGEVCFDTCMALHVKAFCKALAPLGYDFLLSTVEDHDVTKLVDRYLRQEFPDDEEV